MAQILDTFRKDLVHPAGHGWGREFPEKSGRFVATRSAAPASVIIHATHGHPGNSSVNEAKFLRDSADVSSTYLLGRLGECYQILPDAFFAWHAGDVLPPFANDRSIGIELHAAVSEPITGAQKQTLAWLLQRLSAAYHIGPDLVASHRAVAINPPGRKSDPGAWPEAELRAWVLQTLSGFTTPPAPASYTPSSPILAQPGVSLATLTARVPHAGAYTALDVTQVIVPGYWRICLDTGVDPVIALAQMCHETGGLSSWWAQRPQRNPAGLGVTGETKSLTLSQPGPDWQPDRGAKLWKRGLRFDAWDPDAITAHVGRLLAYALTDAQASPAQRQLIDRALALRPLPPAYRGVAPTLEGLNGRWADPGPDYADKVAAWARKLAGQE